MEYRALKELVKQGEGTYLEFKLKSNHPERIIREIVAFANTEGGKLLIGIGDDKSIQGLKHIDEDEFLIVRAIEKYCTPAIEYRLERIPIPGERDVLLIDVPESPLKPHYVVVDPVNDIKRAYVRVLDKSLQASKEVREILKGERISRNIRFSYGDKERTLMHHLDQHERITVDGFASIAGIPRKMASRTLVLLVLANVLEIHPNEMVDHFTARPVV
ncbi:AlbA family DNA-binding domain-containing protein [Tellurirhabdus bombi]|uniref:AlbA family DNA-binding domain-containing protein n=1 Tax=Tellurirhabdus bombi TaxID=2907205 RepID=UPI001F2E28F5|nr:ATP-binding protein [Tellurirhabdus bombi]